MVQVCAQGRGATSRALLIGLWALSLQGIPASPGSEEHRRPLLETLRRLALNDKEQGCEGYSDEAKQCPSKMKCVAKEGNVAQMQELLEWQHLNPNCRFHRGREPLHYAAWDGHLPMVKYLIEGIGVDPSVRNDHGTQPLHYAAQNGHLDVLRYLIEREGVDKDSRNGYGLQPVHYAAWEGYPEEMRYLLRADANPRAKDNEGRQPLHWAAEFGHLDLVKLLINEEGVDAEAKDAEGLEPIHHAAKGGQIRVLEYFIARKGDRGLGILTEPTSQGQSLLSCLFKNLSNVKEKLNFSESLLRRRAARSPTRKTVLMEAASLPSAPAVLVTHLLTRHDVDKHAQDTAGFRARDFAMMHNQKLLSLLPEQNVKTSLENMATSKKFYSVLVLVAAYVLLSAHFIATHDMKSDLAVDAGAIRVAARSTYSPAPRWTARIYRMFEAFSNTVVPMFFMTSVSPPLWCLLLIAFYVLPRVLTEGMQTLRKPGLLPVGNKHSLLEVGIWGPGAGGQTAAAVLRLSFLLFVFLSSHADTWWGNPKGFEAVSCIGHNPSADVCVRAPPLKLFVTKGSWSVTEGDCSLDDETGCLSSPGFPEPYPDSSPCTAEVKGNILFRIRAANFSTEAGWDKLEINNRSFSGSDGPDYVVPHTALHWLPDDYKSDGGWRLCPREEFCFRTPPVREIWSRGQSVALVILLAYLVCSLCLLSFWCTLYLLGGRSSRAPEVLRLAEEIKNVIAAHPAPEDASEAVAEIPTSSGGFVQPECGVSIASVFLLLDAALDLNTCVLLVLNEDYCFAGVILATVLASTVAELHHGGWRHIKAEIAETRRTGVPTAGWLRIIASESGESLVSLLVTAYALPFDAKTPFALMTTSLSLLTSAINHGTYVFSELDLAAASDSSQSDDLLTTESSSESSCSSSESDASCLLHGS